MDGVYQITMGLIRDVPGREVFSGTRLGRRLGRTRDDVLKFLKYGPGFPRRGERIWVEPEEIRTAIVHPTELGLTPDYLHYRKLDHRFWEARGQRGRVISDEKFTKYSQADLLDIVKIRCCIEHWGNGASWEATGIYDHLMHKIEALNMPQSGCATIEDVRERYARLDRIFAVVAREGRLRTQGEVGFNPPPDDDGIEVHIGPDGEPIFGDTGNHRLAMSIVLGFERVPAMLGFVHEDGLLELPDYRRM